MTVTLLPNQAREARGEKDVTGWVRKEVIHTVTGLGTGDKLDLALATTGLPALGSIHPTDTELTLSTVQPELVQGSTNTVNVRCVYTRPSGGSIPTGHNTSPSEWECGSTLQTVQRNTDIHSNLITVSYVKAGSPPTPPTGAIENKVLTCNILMPSTSLTFTRTENAMPIDTANSYVGKINSVVWNVKGKTFAYETWLCTGIVGRSSDGGNTWKVTYTFAYDPVSRWQLRAAYLLNGAIPLDADMTQAVKLYDIYATIDFNALNLT